MVGRILLEPKSCVPLLQRAVGERNELGRISSPQNQEMSSEESSASSPSLEKEDTVETISVECFINQSSNKRWRLETWGAESQKDSSLPLTHLSHSKPHGTHLGPNMSGFSLLSSSGPRGRGVPLSEGNEGHLHQRSAPLGQLSLRLPPCFPGARGIRPHQQPVATHTLQGSSYCQLRPEGAGKCPGTVRPAVGASPPGSCRPPPGP